jgi:hypothetical protein
MSENSNETNPSEYHYAVLMETNGKEFESWYYFIRYEGNEEALNHLQKQIESIDFYILDDLSTFDLDLEHLVSERTAKEMTKLELNALMFHRKFDGKLEKVDLKLSKRDSNDKKLVKIFKRLGIGRIDNYIDDEDIDPENIASDSEVSGSDEETDYNYEISESDSSEEETKSRKNKSSSVHKRRRKHSSSSEDEIKTRSPSNSPETKRLNKLEKMKDKLKSRMKK